ncbi:hypothetical protein L596_014102 [Steinernema carpocapsae]|uniref:Uncharacterized protein n=1 Tax=Steinernema carpocapsae TaxID=34508 RepID=A0A4U5NAY6_STECR|nr:hypothetical protein L596_014102 [Steinernema carpocapsae]
MPSLVKPLFEVSFGMWGNFQMFFDVCMNTYRYLLVPDLFVLVDGEFQLVLDLQSALNNATFNWLEAEKSALQEYIAFVKGCLANATLEQTEVGADRSPNSSSSWKSTPRWLPSAQRSRF